MGHPSLRTAPAIEDLETLVLSAQKGDEAAFSALIERTQDRLFRFLLYLTNHRALAEDLTQDTYLRAFEKLPGLKDPKSFSPWLIRISRNVFLAHVKLHKNSRLHL